MNRYFVRRMRSLTVNLAIFSLLSIFVIPALSSVAAPLAPFADPGRIKYAPLAFVPPTANRVILKNGLPLYILEDHELPLIRITALIRTGSMYDPPGKEGLAELTARVMKTGGVEGLTGSALDEELEQMAVSLHVSVNRDSGLFSLSCLSKDLDKALNTFSRILTKPVFEEEKLSLAKDLKIGELRRISDDPQKLAFREFGRLMHEGSPRGRLVTRRSVNNIQREDLFRHHNLFYHPKRVMISISGDIDRKASESAINRYFGEWKSSEAKIADPSLPRPPEGGIYFIPREGPQSVIIFGWIAPSKNDLEFFPSEIIDFLTGSGGFRSRMFQKIRTDRGLAYSTGSFYTAKSEYGLFGAYALTKSESTTEVISLIRTIIQEINDKPIPPDELKKIKNAIVNSFIFSFTSSDKIVFQQMMTDYENLPEDYVMTYRDNIEKVTIADIAKTARHFDPKGATILIIGNDAVYNAVSGREAVRKIEIQHD
ncbi:MAG: M16 family metallopeptidase [Syntrophales bacterium]